MGRKSRNRVLKYASARADAPRLRAPDLIASASQGSFPAAEWSRDRGYVYFPQLDSEREVDSWSRTELMKRTRAMYNGIGFVRGMVNTISRMVCGTGLAPQAMTSSEEWNKKAEAYFRGRTSSRQTFHLARKYSFASSQRAVMRSMLKDGDALAVFARNENDALRVMLYEGNQIGTGSTNSKGWVDGVKLDRHRGATDYGIITADEFGRSKRTEIPADQSILCVDYERIGQARGISCLYHAVNRLLDRGEILSAMTKGIKLSQQMGYAIETTSPTQTPGVGNLTPSRPTVTVAGPDGPITLERLLGGGEISALAPGQSIKILQDDRPHPNVVNHLDGLIRDVSLGTGFFPEVLYNASALGSAASRFVMAGTQGTIEEKQELIVETYCGPVYLAYIADGIAQGDLEFHPEWMMHGWLPPGRMTIDFGRDGKLHIEQYKQGMITMRTLYGYRGEDFRSEMSDYLDERKFMKAEAERRGLTLQEAFPQFYGNNVGAQTPAAATEDPEKEDPDDDIEDPEEEDSEA